MTLYPGSILGGYWPSGPGGIGPEVKRTDTATATPPKGEAKPKNGYGIPVYFGGASMLWGGETAGWVQPPRGSYDTYRKMDLHPMLCKLRATYDRLRWGEWEWKKRDDDVADERLKQTKADFAPLRYGVVSESLRAIPFGHRGFQKVWALRDGRYVIDDLIGYEPDGLQICHYEGRPHAFAGLTWGNADTDRLPPNKSFLFTLNGEGGNLYGVPYYEAAYDSWCGWNRSRWDRIGVGKKLGGILPVLKFPKGQSQIDGAGTMEDNGSIARKILASLRLGHGAAIPNSPYDPDTLQSSPDLAKLPGWELDFLDAGNHSSAVAGIVEGQSYDDKGMCRAMRLSERGQIEAVTAGSRADSETHTDTDVSQLESVGGMIAHAFSVQCVDDYLVTNYGPGAKGEVYAVQAPLTDRKTAVFREYMGKVQANPAFGQVLIEDIDNEAVASHLGLPVSKELNEKFKAAAKAAAQQKEEDRKIAAAGAKPGANGNGKTNGRVAALSRGAAWLGEMLGEDGE